jgi:hypothetical protein
VFACRREAVHEDVVADEQRVLHGAGGNLKVLDYECDNEKAGDKNGSKAGNRFRQGFLLPDLLLPALFCVFGFLG